MCVAEMRVVRHLGWDVEECGGVVQQRREEMIRSLTLRGLFVCVGTCTGKCRQALATILLRPTAAIWIRRLSIWVFFPEPDAFAITCAVNRAAEVPLLLVAHCCWWGQC